ncbi:MAG: phytoene desaturase [Pyrinomonadaceae bacterium]|nr:phytoene desaturase [Pyrinomonadaceae bacterium]
MSKSVIIIGAGLGGLAAAVRLASNGVRVRVLEKNATLGGKVNIHRAAGYTFDTGASLLTMRHVLAELFQSAGRSVEDYLETVALEPICRYFWADGATFDASTNLDKTEREIERIASRSEVEGFRLFLKDARRKYEVAERTFLAYILNDFPNLLLPRYDRDLAAISSLRTLDAHVRRYFHSPHLQQLFNRFATYNGSSPYSTPATFALSPYVEFGLGAWYVRGGMYKLPLALAALAEELGVEIRTGAEVEEILIERGRACGVRFNDGEVLRADAVLANSDAVDTYRRLIKTEARRIYTNRRLEKLEPSSSGFVLLLGVARRYPQLAHHNIFFSPDYPAEFHAIFEDKRPAAYPTIYVCASSRTDETQSPAGHENLFVLVNAPATSPHTNWTNEAGSYRDLIVRLLEESGLEGLGRAIDYERMITPVDFEQTYYANRGSIYGISSNKRRSAFLRPPNKARDIDGLYFAGGATHPGGGIPLVLLSGKMAAELLLPYT